MKVWLKILFLFFLAGECRSQGYDNLWMMGYQCCQPNFGGTDIDFATGSPIVTSVFRQMNFNITNASITNSSGNLLFYTNGWYIANSANDTMVNGSGLALDPQNSSYRQNGLPIVQGALIVPFDETPQKYYLFHEELSAPLVFPIKLYYSVIDMSLDSGRGAVILKRQPLFHDTLDYGQIAACRHANGRDWWVLVPKIHSDVFYIILSTPYGLSYETQNLGFTVLNTDAAGQSTFSPDGTKFARFAVDEGLNCFDFDRCTGTFSNLRNIPQSAFPAWQGCEGVSFSPNSRILYLSYCTYLYQVDTWDSSLINSRILIDTYDGFTDPFPTTFFSSKLASDGKIYMSSSNGVETLHVINSPNSLGIACDFRQHSFPLPTYNSSTMNSAPSFSLGAITGSSCDSLLNGISNVEENDVLLYPNPASELIRIHLNRNEHYQVSVYDIKGKILKQESSSGNEDVTLYLNDIASGIYFLKINTGKKSLYRRFIKE